MRPRWTFLNFTFFGINMMSYLQPLVGPQRVLLALVDPALHADLAEARLGLRRAVVDVGAQGVQRQLAVQVPLGARDLGAVQAAGHADLDPLGPEAQRGVDGLAHGAAEGDALLELQRHRLRHQLGVELGLQDLLDVDEDLLAGLLLDFLLQLVHFLALAADDDAGARGVDADLQLVGRALDVHVGHPGVGEPLLEVLLELDVLVQQVRVFLLGVPAAPPGLVETEPETDGMDLLTHYFDSWEALFFGRSVLDFFVRAARSVAPAGLALDFALA